MYYIITFKRKQYLAFGYYQAVQLAHRLAKGGWIPAYVKFNFSNQPSFRVWCDGTVEHRVEHTTCDFCMVCTASSYATCNLHPRSWVRWEVDEE